MTTNQGNTPKDLLIRGMTPLLQVFDMPASIAVYRDVLGFVVVRTSEGRGPDEFDWALLEIGDTPLMLNTAYEVNERPEAPEHSRHAAHGDTVLFFHCRDVDAVYASLLAKGISADAPAVTPYGMKQLNLHDPDGYGICFQCPVAS